MPTNNISLTAPTETGIDVNALQRRMALAQALQQQSMENPKNEMVSGVMVKQSPVQGIARLAQALMAKKMNQDSDSQMRTLAQQQQQNRMGAIDQMGDIPPEIKAGLTSSDPFVQQIARAQLEARQKATDRQAELQAKTADARSLQAERLQAQQQAQQERLAAQQAQAERDAQLRRELAAQASADRRAMIDAANARAGQKNTPKLPPAALKMQQEELDAIGTSSTINADLGAIQKQIETGKLQLGPVNNMMGKVKNTLGVSDESSRNLATFQATLEKLRNDSLRLNKGVQTDGDAQRAWNELMTNINDPNVVKQRLGEIQKINERAVALRKMNVDVIRRNYGAEDLDTSGYQNQPAAVGGGGGSNVESLLKKYGG